MIHNLVDIAAKGGNYLLNVGPTAEGLFPKESINRLHEIGEWMKVNGEVIHNSRGTANYKENESIYYIQSKDHKYLYAVLTQWPGTSIQLKYAIPEAGSDITLLGYDNALGSRTSEAAGLIIDLPMEWKTEEKRPVKYAWVIKIIGHQAKVAKSPEFYSDNKLIKNKVLFSDSIGITLKSTTEGSSIYYTTDDSEPTPLSKKYNKLIMLTKSATIRSISEKEGYVTSPVSFTSFLQSTTFQSIEFEKPYSPKYSALGNLSLGDGIFGNEDNFHENWLGFQGTDMVAKIDLGDNRTIHQVSVNFLQATKSWIFLPEFVELSISEDGINFKTIAKVENTIPLTENGNNAHLIKMDFKTVQVRFIKIKAKSIIKCPEWHTGAGNKAWLFVDEIIVE